MVGTTHRMASSGSVQRRRRMLSRDARVCHGPEVSPRTLIRVAVLFALIPSAGAEEPDTYRKPDPAWDAGVAQEGEKRTSRLERLPPRGARTVIRAATPQPTALPEPPPPPVPAAAVRMALSGIRIEGPAGVDVAGLEEALQPWRGRELSFIEFEQVVHTAAQYLREHGHPNAQVVMSGARVRGGTLALAIQGLTPPAAEPTAVAETAPVETAPVETAPVPPVVAEAPPAEAPVDAPVDAPEVAAVAPPVADTAAGGETVPDAGTAVADAAVPVESVAPPPPPLPAPVPVNAPPKVYVRGFEVAGVTAVPAEEVQASLEPWKDRMLSLPEMEESVQALVAFLHAKGYKLAQAWLPPQRIDGGTVQIAVQEGLVDGQSGQNGLTVTGDGNRVQPERMREYLAAAVQPGQPLNVDTLERALRIVNELPGIRSVQSDLMPGSTPGTTQVQAKVTDGDLFAGAVSFDNFGSTYAGEGRGNSMVNWNSPLGYGEQFSFSSNHSSGMTGIKLSGQIPVGVQGFRLGGSYAATSIDVGKELGPLNLNSESRMWSLFGSYPLERNSRRTTDMMVMLDRKEMKNDMSGFRLNDRLENIAALALSGTLVDPWQGTVGWDGSVAWGDLDLSGNASYQAMDRVTTQSEGSFGKLNLNLNRLMPLDEERAWSLYTSLRSQWATGNLDSAEKFQLGGPAGVRAYPVGEGLGDFGWQASLELRRSFGPVVLNGPDTQRDDATPPEGEGDLASVAAAAVSNDRAWNLGEAQMFGFVDLGGVQQYANLWDGALPADRSNQYTLAGYGVGVGLVHNERGGVRLMVAQKAGNNPNPTAAGTDSDGQNKSTRVWIVGNILF